MQVSVQIGLNWYWTGTELGNKKWKKSNSKDNYDPKKKGAPQKEDDPKNEYDPQDFEGWGQEI